MKALNSLILFLIILLGTSLAITTLAINGLNIISPKNGQMYNYGQKLILSVQYSPDAIISVDITTPNGNTIPLGASTTNSQGYLNLTLLIWGSQTYSTPGEYIISVEANGGEAAAVLDVYYEPSDSNILVTVTNFQNQPIDGATVYFYNITNGIHQLVDTNTTNPSGLAGFYFIPLNLTQKFQVVVSYPNYPNISQIVNVSGLESVPITIKLPPPHLMITFVEEGLPKGTLWSVTINGTTNSSSSNKISFILKPGTYTYRINAVNGFNASPSTGTVELVQNETINVIFSVINYEVNFKENGLAQGIVWKIDIFGKTVNDTNINLTLSSSSNAISIKLPDGNYTYHVIPIENYTISPLNGTLTVDNSNVNVSITFSIVHYYITFIENGLPSGDQWSVTLNGITKSSTSNQITFEVTPGIYQYLIQNESLYVSAPSYGTIIAPTFTQSLPNQMPSHTNITIIVDFYSFHTIPLIVSTGNGNISIKWNSTNIFPEYYTVEVFNNGHLVQKINSTSPTINFNNPGNYTIYLTIKTNEGYINITKTITVYQLNFTIPVNSVNWGVNVNGKVYMSSKNIISLLLPSGNYTYQLLPPKGYFFPMYKGTINLNSDKSISFNDFTLLNPESIQGTPTNNILSLKNILIIVTIIVVIAILALTIIKRK